MINVAYSVEMKVCHKMTPIFRTTIQLLYVCIIWHWCLKPIVNNWLNNSLNLMESDLFWVEQPYRVDPFLIVGSSSEIVPPGNVFRQKGVSDKSVSCVHCDIKGAQSHFCVACKKTLIFPTFSPTLCEILVSNDSLYFFFLTPWVLLTF